LHYADASIYDKILHHKIYIIILQNINQKLKGLSMLQIIKIRGARTHNLKNIDLDLPKNKLIVITGVSGSGKSSLAFDTIYAEGQRRYVESLSSYARQFLQQMNKPDVDLIEGLSPAISIEQKSTSHNPRSTVGTVTEIYDYLRLLYARIGEPHCPTHKQILKGQTVSQIVDNIMSMQNNTKIAILSPVVSSKKGTHTELITQIQSQGFTKLNINNKIIDIDGMADLDKNKKHDIDIVIDRIKITPEIKNRLTESIEIALQYGSERIKILNLENNITTIFSSKFSCNQCEYSLLELEPKNFSFNNPHGACTSCDGLGIINFFDQDKIICNKNISIASGGIIGWEPKNTYTYPILEKIANHFKFDLDIPIKDLSKNILNILFYGSKEIILQDKKNKFIFEGILNILEQKYNTTENFYLREELNKFKSIKKCHHCNGNRIKPEYQVVMINNISINEVTNWPLNKCLKFFENINLSGFKEHIGAKIINEIKSRLKFLIDVGLDYVNLSRSAETLSGGEAQRIRLASQIGSGLTGVMYVLDEPSIGLHQRDNDKLIKTLKKLRDLGNTVIVVEHDEEAICEADYIIDIGPMAGEHGGKVVASGTIEELLKNKNSLTSQYLNGDKSINVPKKRRNQTNKYLTIEGASGHNLKNINLSIPIGNFVCITGVSGSGKSTLINDTLYKVMANLLNNANHDPANFTKINGYEYFDKVINVDQSPIGRTPRSNPATYTGLFTHIRELFANTNIAKERGYNVGRFSFNVKGGRCEACSGDGLIKVEMHFLPDIYVECDICKGKRYNRETLEIFYKGKNIHEVLELTVDEAYEFFKNIPTIKKKLSTLKDVGLNYIRLGQAATTLSGGEAQRVKLALELSKRDTGKTLYILDEPTTGLHFYDIDLLLNILHKFVDNGNTVVVIEHNLDIVKTADWIIDLGPEGGDNGGIIIAEGSPEDIIKTKNSYTAKYLKKYLSKG
jgi:excinuclease ABC subunit A